MNTRRRLRRAPVVPLLCAGLGILFVLGSAPAPALAAPERGSEERVSDWLSAKAERFAANPEAMTQRGTGWKPYNRFKWFYEQRMVNGEEPPVGARIRGRLQQGYQSFSGSRTYTRSPVSKTEI